MKMRADYNHVTGRWEITDTDAIPPSTFAEISDEASAKLLANAANNFAPMLSALETALTICDAVADGRAYDVDDMAVNAATVAAEAIRAARKGI